MAKDNLERSNLLSAAMKSIVIKLSTDGFARVTDEMLIAGAARLTIAMSDTEKGGSPVCGPAIRRLNAYGALSACAGKREALQTERVKFVVAVARNK
ncbi:hypothetical protein AB4Y38_39840 [Paraburkholderia sp. EG285A]|uniref:hypothetical protein n=1 Tax=Paraburkholderia sp. EG285A TaxID=3237009 RepID=UPI0034D1F150